MQGHEDGAWLTSPARLEAFSDAVMAIAITLLVLEVKVPHLPDGASGMDALHALGGLAPKLISYLLAFFFIAVFWTNHHQFLRRVRHVDHRLLWLNMLFLLSVSFVPFPTAVAGEYPWNPVSLLFFSSVLMLAGIAMYSMRLHALRSGLFDARVGADAVHRAARRGLAGIVLYAVAGALGFVQPLASWVLFFAIPLLYVRQRSD